MVADASAIVEVLLRTPRSAVLGNILDDAEVDVHVPTLCDIEVASALRRLRLSRQLSDVRQAEALADYVDLPLTRHGHLALLPRVLTLADNFSAYDGAYVALAEGLAAELVSADERLRRAVESHTEVSTLDAGEPGAK